MGLPPRYVPILTGRQGELIALGKLSAAHKGALTPLLDIPPIPRPHPPKPGGKPAKPVDPPTELRKLLRDLQTHWGADRDAMIDLDGFEQYRPDSFHPVEFVVRRAVDQRMPLILMTSSKSSIEYVDAIRDSHYQLAGRGIRVYVNSDQDARATSDTADALLERIGASPPAIDLLIDFGRVDISRDGFSEGVGTCMRSLREPERWRSVTVAATTIPESMPSATFKRQLRVEWDAWQRFSSSSPGWLHFADYGITGPRKDNDDPTFGPAPHLRYTVDDAYLMWKGRKADPGEGGAVQSGQTYPDLCSELLARSAYKRPRSFRGRTFSWGDHCIEETAARRRGPGGAREWIQYATNHHLVQVVEQIRALNG